MQHSHTGSLVFQVRKGLAVFRCKTCGLVYRAKTSV